MTILNGINGYRETQEARKVEAQIRFRAAGFDQQEKQPEPSTQEQGFALT